MGLHSDDEKELGKKPVIASLSLGETREIYFKHKNKKLNLIIPQDKRSTHSNAWQDTRILEA